jgi:hypothetical protein
MTAAVFGHVCLDGLKNPSYGKLDVCAAWLCLAEVSLVAGAKKGEDKNNGNKNQNKKDQNKKDQNKKDQNKKDQNKKDQNNKDQGGKKADNKAGNKDKDNKVKPSPDVVRTGLSCRFSDSAHAHMLGFTLKSQGCISTHCRCLPRNSLAL